MKKLREIFPIHEDMGTGAMGTGAIQGFDGALGFAKPFTKKKKQKSINKDK